MVLLVVLGYFLMFVYVMQLLVTRATQAWLLCLVHWDTGMQHHCCVVVYWMCCCVLDVLVRLLQLVVGKARATNMQCQAPFVELPLNYKLYSGEKYIQKKVQKKYIC